MFNTRNSISFDTLHSKPTILKFSALGDDEEKTFVLGAVLTAIELQLALIVGKRNQLHLAVQQELDLPAQPGARILVAEDDPALARTICLLLERAGFVVTHAADGIDAWQMANTQAFDVALLDVDMPGLTGDEVCRRIKASPALSHLPVVLFSGQEDLETLAAKAGADAFLEKPAGLLRLPTCLKQLLGQ
jgi:CheY-like chemotaxis protein